MSKTKTDELKSTLIAADAAVNALAQLVEAMSFDETESPKHAALVRVLITSGEYRDQLHSMVVDLQKADVLPNPNKKSEGDLMARIERLEQQLTKEERK